MNNLPVIKRKLQERIMLYGQAGDGKSYSTFTVAAVSQQLGKPARFFFVDTDCGSERTLQTAFPWLTNIDIFEVSSWLEADKALDKISSLIKPERGDFLVIDLFCKLWDWAQEHYTEKVFHKGIDDFFLEMRENLASSGSKKVNPFDGLKDWTIIKKLYKTLAQKIFFKLGANVIICSTASPVNDKLDSESIVTKYGRVGFKPSGYKDTDHDVHTVIFMQQKKEGRDRKYWMRTVKDRGRVQIDCQVSEFFGVDQNGNQVVLGGFANDYLMRIAGWNCH